MTETKNTISSKVYQRLFALAMPYKGLFVAAIALAVCLAPLAILRPYLIQHTVDNYILALDGAGLVKMVVILISVLIVEAFLTYCFIYATGQLGQSVIRDLRVRVFRHILNLRLSYFDRTPIGTSTTRTINDVETINTVFSEGIITIAADIVSLVVVLAMMLFTSWKLTLICLTTLPLLLWATYIFKENVNKSYQTVRTQVATMNAFLQERISGMRVVQIFNAEGAEMTKFKTINDTYTKANIDSVFYYAIFFPVVDILAAVSLGLLIWWGARGVVGGELTLGVLIAFPMYLNQLFRPVRMLADKFNTLQMGLVASERVFQLLDSDERIPNEGLLQPTKFNGFVEFDHVSFAYNDADWVLHDVSFAVHTGETLAIVGSTGSGKSTIVGLISRLYDIQKGQIRIDGNDIKAYELFHLRRKIAVVLQDVFLFTGSVLENITLRDASISKEQVITAAKMIGAHDYIVKLPNGYDYEVMERGATLSLGMRQLISFVRALVFNPDILILDEATSSVDPETESVIQYAIEQLITRRTSIIIAHRLSTIRHADSIMVVDKGRIVEFGSHYELMQVDSGHYRTLYNMQFIGSGGTAAAL
jgi:ATP-binding cassette subfamily B multidrug efflux pump